MSGDFHGGDFHSGGFHDAGGSFGGGDIFGTGGGDYYDDGGESGLLTGSSGSPLLGLISYGTLGTVIITFISVNFFFSSIPGINIYNLCMFCAGFALLIIGMKDYARTSALGSIRRGKMPKHTGDVRHGRYDASFLCDGRSWADPEKNRYLISFSDSDFGTDNAEKVYDTMKRTPGIIWMNLFVWAAAVIAFTISHVFFYELIIPYFENRIMTDQAFSFVDVLTFYLPAVLVLLCGVACLIIVRVRDSILHKCAVRIVKDNEAVEERRETEDFIASKLSQKWYYNTCPNCGAEAKVTQSACKVCGSSLEVPSFENSYPGSVHRLAAEPAKDIPEELDEDDAL